MGHKELRNLENKQCSRIVRSGINKGGPDNQFACCAFKLNWPASWAVTFFTPHGLWGFYLSHHRRLEQLYHVPSVRTCKLAEGEQRGGGKAESVCRDGQMVPARGRETNTYAEPADTRFEGLL